MSFTQAALVIVAIAAVVLGLVAYHLLNRIDLLERAIQGGLEPPSRRLAREEYELRFRRALARAELARHVDTGLVLVLGSESTSTTSHEVASALANLSRGDGITLLAATPEAEAFIGTLQLPGASSQSDLAGGDAVALIDALGVAITPHAFVVDDGRVTVSKPVLAAADLADLVTRHT